jgi:RND family efflux transporter MFP subunit
MKKWITLAVILCLAGGFAWFKWRNTIGFGGSTPEDGHPATAAVILTNIQFSINAAGDIGPADQVSVRPEINGKISTLAVDLGDRVKKGDLLFALDDQDLQTERSSRLTEIDGAKLQVDKAKRNFDRAEQLYADKLVSLEVNQDARTEYELSKNALERAQRQLNQVEDRLTKTKIVAPFDCTVLTRPVSVGQAVSGSGGFNSGTEVLTIANLNDMIINAHINQADVTRLSTNQQVEIEVEAVQGLKLKGAIERIAPQATIKNGIKGFATRIQLKSLEERVRPGMTANLSIPIASAENVLSVPLAAIFSEQGERYSWVKNGAGFERKEVQIGVADFFSVEVKTGLKAGDIVALEPPPEAANAGAVQPTLKTAQGSATNTPGKPQAQLAVGGAKTAVTTNRPAATTR